MKKILVWGVLLAGLRGAVLAGEDPLRFVDPFIGTEYEGHCYPGPAAPFSMIQPGPETFLGGTDLKTGKPFKVSCIAPGYMKRASSLIGFTQTHFSGTGCVDFDDFLFQPFCGATPREVPLVGHKNPVDEVSRCGYYAVSLTNLGVRVEITASRRAGVYRVHWLGSGERKLLVDLQYSNISEWSPKYTQENHVLASDCALGRERRSFTVDSLIEGWSGRHRFAGVFRFSHPWTRVQQLTPKPGNKAKRLVFTFGGIGDEPLEIRTAVSGVDVEGACANLDAEAPARVSFEDVRVQTERTWRELLGRARIAGPERQKRIFYTALYHMYLQPNTFSDVDGRYRATSGGRYFKPGPDIIRKTDDVAFTGFSLWDTFRATQPFYTLMTPEIVDPCIRSFLDQYQASGCLPMETFFGVETCCMIGIHAVPVIVDAYLKGFRGFDVNQAFEACTNAVTVSHPCRAGREHYEVLKTFDYLPFDHPSVGSGNVAITLELAYDEACVARFAEALGKPDVARRFRERAARWRHLFDPSTLLMRGRDSKGKWREPFDPFRVTWSGKTADYVEESAWGYTWFVPHDPQGLIAAFGGPDVFAEKLQFFFCMTPELESWWTDPNPRPPRGHYHHDNEPSHHAAYFFSLAGRPDLTAEVVRRIVDKNYSDRPEGVVGNDDCGQMSAWYVFACLGFYPFDAFTATYVVGAPQAERVELDLGQGRTLHMVVKNFGGNNRYVKRVVLNGVPLEGVLMKHADLVRGGELVFEMTDKGIK